MNNKQDSFLAANSFAVAGASRDRSKYGNIVFKAILNSGRVVYPVHPNETHIEGATAYPNLTSLPEVVESLSIVTPPHVTIAILKEAISVGVKHVWMQPGAENDEGSRLAREAGLTVIDDSSCILVSLRHRV